MFKTALKYALLAAFALVPLVSVAQVPQPGAGLSISHYIGAATTNSTLVVANTATQKHALYGVSFVNTNATTYYLKFYDTVAAPVCGTAVPIAVFQMLQNASKTLVSEQFAIPVTNGIGLCIVGGVANSDTAAGATGISVDVFWK